VKLQTQENHWKTKMEDMETQHRRDIERLNSELKVTQQVADHMKSEYASKVQDLERLSMDQSNMLVEQKKQLNNLSREINNSQMQINHRNYREKDTIERFHESPLIKMKRNSSYNDEGYYKSSYSNENGEVIIEDICSGSSQECSGKLMSVAAENKHVSSRNDNINNKRDNKKFITDPGKTVSVKTNSKNSGNLGNVRKMKDRTKHDANDANETNDRKKFTTKENMLINSTNKKHVGIKNVQKRGTLRIDNMRNNKKLESLMTCNVSDSMMESEFSSSSMTQSESDESESATATDDVTVKRYGTPVKSSNISKVPIREDAKDMFDNRLKDLGIDPEWQGIPVATFKQKMEIVKHQQNINAKKLNRYNQIKQKILEDVLQRISTKESGSLAKKSPLDKLVTRVKSRALKAFGTHKDDGNHYTIILMLYQISYHKEKNMYTIIYYIFLLYQNIA